MELSCIIPLESRINKFKVILKKTKIKAFGPFLTGLSHSAPIEKKKKKQKQNVQGLRFRPTVFRVELCGN